MICQYVLVLWKKMIGPRAMDNLKTLKCICCMHFPTIFKLLTFNGLQRETNWSPLNFWNQTGIYEFRKGARTKTGVARSLTGLGLNGLRRLAVGGAPSKWHCRQAGSLAEALAKRGEFCGRRLWQTRCKIRLNPPFFSENRIVGQ